MVTTLHASNDSALRNVARGAAKWAAGVVERHDDRQRDALATLSGGDSASPALPTRIDDWRDELDLAAWDAQEVGDDSTDQLFVQARAVAAMQYALSDDPQKHAMDSV